VEIASQTWGGRSESFGDRTWNTKAYAIHRITPMPAQMRVYVLSTPNDQTSSAMPQRPAGILKKSEKRFPRKSHTIN
jgi:hypothetical protein